MTLRPPLPQASPVDFERYGESGGWAKPPRPPVASSLASGQTAARQGSAQTADPGRQAADDGQFVRAAYPFKGRIGDPSFPAEPGRYVLYISYACPWAQRQAIVRELKGLQDVIGLAVVDPVRDGRGWAFRAGPDLTLDPFNGFTLLRQAYDATEPAYPGHISVPVLWDNQAKRIVSNNFPDISLDLGSRFNAWAANPGLDLYPTARRGEIDHWNDLIYRTVNNGVYRCGFARSQAAYDRAVAELFATLDQLEEHLRTRVYLVGEQLTEADIRLWPTLVRFDAVYATHFKTNRRRLVDYDNLWDYARFLYQQPAFAATTKFDHIKRHYFITHPHINPTRIVPVGYEVDWQAPTRRAL
jgi:putative glutathione S-transferase